MLSGLLDERYKPGVKVVLVPSISTIDITETLSILWSLYSDESEAQIGMEDWKKQGNGYNKSNLIEFFISRAYIIHTPLFLVLQ